jgi:hypothetical protein
MKDWIAKRVYLSTKRRGIVARILKRTWQVQKGLAVPPRMIASLISYPLLPLLYAHGGRLWSKEMYDKQLQDDGLL